MGLKLPSGSAVAVLVTCVVGGIAIAYLPTQISETESLQESWQARYGPEISTVGLAIFLIAVVWFAIAHIRWPKWLTGLSDFRLKAYRAPYGPDQFVADSRQAVPASLAVVSQSVDLEPYGWDEADPFIRLTYQVFNGSMFGVTFGAPSGEMYLGNRKFHDSPKVYQGGGTHSPHSTAQIHIDQRLKLEFWNQLKEEAAKGSGSVILSLNSGINISVQADYPGSKAFAILLAANIPYTLTRK